MHSAADVTADWYPSQLTERDRQRLFKELSTHSFVWDNWYVAISLSREHFSWEASSEERVKRESWKLDRRTSTFRRASVSIDHNTSPQSMHWKEEERTTCCATCSLSIYSKQPDYNDLPPPHNFQALRIIRSKYASLSIEELTPA